MEYIIFGAGKTGRAALNFLGYERVKCFADNNEARQEYYGKEVITFRTLKQMDPTDIIIVIASELYYENIERQFLENGITRYFIFHENHPILWNEVLPGIGYNKKYETLTYNRIFARERMGKYKKIAIFGENCMLPYLISEIEIQSNCHNVHEIISDADYEAKTCMGIPIRTWEEADKEIDCLVVNVRKQNSECREQLESVNPEIKVIDIYDPEYGEPLFYHSELRKYKDIHKGKRIFLIGNGPSMRLEDIEKLHEKKEICIACNKIFKIYDKTEWRADYLLMSDPLIIQGCIEDIPNIPGEIILADCFNEVYGFPYFENAQYIHPINYYDIKDSSKFSEDICKGTYVGGTVLYTIGLQLAAYMGASEIYLIGVDNNYTRNVTDSVNHFIEGYFNEEDKKRYNLVNHMRSDKSKVDKAFEKAEAYSRKKGFRIYNATRGGKVEAFERVDFDQLSKD